MEREKTELSVESSKEKEAIIIDDTNPSVEENPVVTEELLRLKELFEIGMFKSVQGHQYLCDILKKALLHRNPRKEGVGFERKLNADGTYWKPEQYAKTVWVLAKEKPIDIANLSGFSCKIDTVIVDESLDSNYKLFKDNDGKVIAQYVGANCRNGSPKRQIWVLKSLIEKLPTNHSMQGKAVIPPRHYYSLEERNDPLVTESNAPQKDYECVDRYVYRHKGNRDKIAYAHQYTNPPPRRNYAHKSNVSARPVISTTASKSPTQMWVVKKN